MINLIQKIAANKIRKQFGSFDKKRDEGQTTPSDITRFDNIKYGDDPKWPQWQLLDVYRPKDIKGKLPVIISVHGGGWVYGNKDVYQFYCMRLARRGFAVVNFSYRLAPEKIFPAAIEDTEKVFNWVCNNAEQYEFDLNNVFAVGDSAGAHLLSLYASAVSNEEYAKNYPFIHKKNLTLRGVALNCGKYKLKVPGDDQNITLLVKGYLPHHGTEEELIMIDGSAHVTKNFPPAFVMTCKGDFLYSQAAFMTKALEEAGVQFEYRCYGSDEKPLWHVFHCDPHLEEAVICNDDESNFFKKLCIN